MQSGTTQDVKARWESNGAVLRMERRHSVLASQGKEQLSSDKQTLGWKQTRTPRTTGPELRYVFSQHDTRQAYVMKLTDTREMSGNGVTLLG